jgi:transposase
VFEASRAFCLLARHVTTTATGGGSTTVVDIAPSGRVHDGTALHLAVISRMRVDERTRAHVAGKTTEGHSKLEIIRCLKRYLAREVYHLRNPAQAGTTAKARTAA